MTNEVSSQVSELDPTPSSLGSSLTGPGSVMVSPMPVIQSGLYGVYWDCSYMDCIIEEVDLVEIKTAFGPSFSTSTISGALTTTTCGGHVCATGTASKLLPTNYRVDIQWIFSGTNRATELSVVVATSNPTTSTQASTQSPSNPTLDSSNTNATAASSSAPNFTAGPAGPISPVMTPIPSGDSSGLTTATKVGIAIGSLGFALLVLIAIILVCRRSRQRQLRDRPNGMPYSHDLGSTNRDLAAEKEMHIIASPVDTLRTGYTNASPIALSQNRSQSGSWAIPDERAAAGDAAAPELHTDTHRRSYGSDSVPKLQEPTEIQAQAPYPTTAGSAIQRKPVSSQTQYFREPGMSDDDLARLEEEERRIDEAIAEAERRRQQLG